MLEKGVEELRQIGCPVHQADSIPLDRERETHRESTYREREREREKERRVIDGALIAVL